jgi:hypothetical protein
MRAMLSVMTLRAEPPPGQQRSHYLDFSGCFNPAVPAAGTEVGSLKAGNGGGRKATR